MAATTGQPDGGPDALTGYVERSDDGSDIYTVAPANAEGYDRMSQWISVPVDHVSDLDAVQ